MEKDTLEAYRACEKEIYETAKARGELKKGITILWLAYLRVLILKKEQELKAFKK